MSDKSNLGRAIASLRHSVGMTQEELARVLAIDRSYLGHIERGKRKPPPHMMFAIMEALAEKGADKVELDTLLAEYEKPSRSLTAILDNLIKAITRGFAEYDIGNELRTKPEESALVLYFTRRYLLSEEVYRGIANGTLDFRLTIMRIASLMVLSPETTIAFLVNSFGPCREDVAAQWSAFYSRFDYIILRAVAYAADVLADTYPVVSSFVSFAIEHDRQFRDSPTDTDNPHQGPILPTLEYLSTLPNVQGSEQVRQLVFHLVAGMRAQIAE